MANLQSVIRAQALVFSSFVLLAAQAQMAPPASSAQEASPAFTADYPANRAGILIHGDAWMAVANQNPTKTKAAHGIAAGLSYGLVPAKIVAEYDGDHASAQIPAGQPVICVCHFMSIPGNPVIVRLHPKKGARELDGGRMIVYPVVGGSKMADANKTDIVPVDVTQPDPQVWLVRPQSPLEPGEYALMLGSQNISIFPFTVVPESTPSNPAN